MKRNPFFLALVALLSIVIGAGPAFAVPTVSNSPASATRPGYVTTGTQTFAGAKTFTGAVTLGTVNITNLIVGGTLGVTGNFAVNTNKFTVAATTGNTQVAGTFGSTGAATLDSTLAVAGTATFNNDVTIGASKVTMAAATGNTAIAGTLGVTGLSTLTGGARIDAAASNGGALRLGANAQTLATNTVIGARAVPTATSGTEAIIVGHISPNPGSASTANYIGVAGYSYGGSVNTGSSTFTASYFDAKTDNAVGSLIGVRSRVRSASTGTVSTAYGVYADMEVTAATPITTAYGLYATGTNTGGGTIGTYYGLRLAAAAAYATATWGVYVDAARSFFGGGIVMGSTSGPLWNSGAGTPEGAVTAPIGSMWTRTDGGAGTTLYVKESGTGNTGWVAK